MLSWVRCKGDSGHCADGERGVNGGIDVNPIPVWGGKHMRRRLNLPSKDQSHVRGSLFPSGRQGHTPYRGADATYTKEKGFRPGLSPALEKKSDLIERADPMKDRNVVSLVRPIKFRERRTLDLGGQGKSCRTRNWTGKFPRCDLASIALKFIIEKTMGLPHPNLIATDFKQLTPQKRCGIQAKMSSNERTRSVRKFQSPYAAQAKMCRTRKSRYPMEREVLSKRSAKI